MRTFGRSDTCSTAGTSAAKATVVKRTENMVQSQSALLHRPHTRHCTCTNTPVLSQAKTGPHHTYQEQSTTSQAPATHVGVFPLCSTQWYHDLRHHTVYTVKRFCTEARIARSTCRPHVGLI